jgi:hypothetical protein
MVLTTPIIDGLSLPGPPELRPAVQPGSLPAPTDAPAVQGTPVVVYACLAAGHGLRQEPPEQVLHRFLTHVRAVGWEPVTVLADRISTLVPREDRPEWPAARAAVERGEAEGIVSPAPVMLWFRQEERESLVNWLRRTGSFVATPGLLIDLRAVRRTGRLLTVVAGDLT